MSTEEKIVLANNIKEMLIDAGFDPEVPDEPNNTLEDLTEQELDDLLNYEAYKLKRPKPIPHV